MPLAHTHKCQKRPNWGETYLLILTYLELGDDSQVPLTLTHRRDAYRAFCRPEEGYYYLHRKLLCTTRASGPNTRSKHRRDAHRAFFFAALKKKKRDANSDILRVKDVYKSDYEQSTREMQTLVY